MSKRKASSSVRELWKHKFNSEGSLLVTSQCFYLQRSDNLFFASAPGAVLVFAV